MKNVIKILASLLFISLNSCSSDEPKNPESPGGSISENNSSVIIKADGTTSTGVVFSPIDNTSFFLDFIKYEIVDSHLEIIGYDPIELAEHVRPYASVTYQGVTYQTRVIRRAVFYNCNRLKSIEIPNTVISIEKAATGSYGAFEGCTNLTSVMLPESLETIGWCTFCGCTSLTSISFPESLETIDSSAFSGCTGLTSISLPESLETIGVSAFSGCTGLTSISFPESLETIGGFSGCTGLTSISLPESLKTIGGGAFSRCTGLTSISLPESLEIIGEDAFSDCTGLTSISFPESLEIIGEGAFYDCTSLTSISFPESLKHIGCRAFDGCTGLTSVTCNAIVPPLMFEYYLPHLIAASEVFEDYTLEHGTLYVPSVSIQKYQNDPGWCYFQNIQGI